MLMLMVNVYLDVAVYINSTVRTASNWLGQQCSHNNYLTTV